MRLPQNELPGLYRAGNRFSPSTIPIQLRLKSCPVLGAPRQWPSPIGLIPIARKESWPLRQYRQHRLRPCWAPAGLGASQIHRCLAGPRGCCSGPGLGALSLTLLTVLTVFSKDLRILYSAFGSAFTGWRERGADRANERLFRIGQLGLGLCRGGSKSLTYPGVDSPGPSTGLEWRAPSTKHTRGNRIDGWLESDAPDRGAIMQDAGCAAEQGTQGGLFRMRQGPLVLPKIHNVHVLAGQPAELDYVVLTLIILVPVRPSRENAISMPRVRRNVCARRSRPASARGFFAHALPLGSASDLLHLCAEVGRSYGLGFVRTASALRTVFGSRAITRR